MVRMCCRPQRHLVELASCDRETCFAAAAAAVYFEWEDRQVRLGLVRRLGWSCCGGGGR